MKSNYVLKEVTILQLENETLREQIKELKAKLKQYETEEKMRQMQGDKGTMGILQTTRIN
jgi:regulator of replication initiation timing